VGTPEKPKPFCGDGIGPAWQETFSGVPMYHFEDSLIPVSMRCTEALHSQKKLWNLNVYVFFFQCPLSLVVTQQFTEHNHFVGMSILAMLCPYKYKLYGL